MLSKSLLPLIALALAGCASPSATTTSKTAPPAAAPSAPAATTAPSAARDGASFETAIVIDAPDEGAGVKAEYDWLRAHLPGGQPAGQALLNHGSKVYDLIHVRLPDGSMRDVYFDITGFFGKLG